MRLTVKILSPLKTSHQFDDSLEHPTLLRCGQESDGSSLDVDRVSENLICPVDKIPEVTVVAHDYISNLLNISLCSTNIQAKYRSSV